VNRFFFLLLLIIIPFFLYFLFYCRTNCTEDGILLLINGEKDKSFAIKGASDYMISRGDNSKIIFLPKAVKVLRKDHLPGLFAWTDNGYSLAGKILPHPKLWGTAEDGTFFDPNDDGDFDSPAKAISFKDASPSKKPRKD
jgi:hypothetical protein